MYSERLKDPRWQKKRLQILQRDEWYCRICYDHESTLVVHHRYYLSGKNPWEYPDEALVALCKSCHEDQHDHLDAAHIHLRFALAKAGAFWQDVVQIARAFECAPTLSEYDWSALYLHLESLLSAGTEGDGWKEVRAKASEEWRRIGKQLVSK